MLLFWQGGLIGLYHPLDGTNLKYKLLCFLTPNKKIPKRKVLVSNWYRCCHLVLCLRLILFHWFCYYYYYFNWKDLVWFVHPRMTFRFFFLIWSPILKFLLPVAFTIKCCVYILNRKCAKLTCLSKPVKLTYNTVQRHYLTEYSVPFPYILNMSRFIVQAPGVQCNKTLFLCTWRYGKIS
jgi:hypothetical protein